MRVRAATLTFGLALLLLASSLAGAAPLSPFLPGPSPAAPQRAQGSVGLALSAAPPSQYVNNSVTFFANMTPPSGAGCASGQPDWCFFNITMGNGAWANSGCTGANSFSYTYGGYAVAGTYSAHSTVEMFSDAACTTLVGSGASTPVSVGISQAILPLNLTVSPAGQWVNDSVTFTAAFTPPAGFGCASGQPDFCIFNLTMGNGAWANSGCTPFNSFSYTYPGYPLSGIYYARASVQMFTDGVCTVSMGGGISSLTGETISQAPLPLSLTGVPTDQLVNSSVTFTAAFTPPTGSGCASGQPDSCVFNITMGNGAWANSGCTASNSFTYAYAGYPLSGIYYARASVQMFTDGVCTVSMGLGVSSLLKVNVSYAVLPLTLVANATSAAPTSPVTFTASFNPPVGLGCASGQPDYCVFNITMGNGAWANSGCTASNSFTYTYPGYSQSGLYEARATVWMYAAGVCTERLGAGVGAPWCLSVSGPSCSLAASVLVDPSTGMNPLVAYFNGSASGGSAPYTYSWDFGDGSPSSSAQDPVHAYASSGSYTVTLTVADHAGNSVQTTTTVTVALSHPLISSLAATPDPTTVGNPTQLSATALGGATPYSYSYAGLPPGCATRDVPLLPCTPTSYGSYWVTLTLTDARGQTASRSLYLAVNPPRAATFPVTFSETGLPAGTAWTVTMNGQTVASTGGALPFSEPNGTYTYAVGAIRGYVPSPSSGSVTVNGVPQAISIVFSAVTATTYPVSFAESGLPSGTTWSVTLGGTAQSGTSGTISFTEPNGSYAFTVSSVAGYRVSPSSGSISVNGAGASQPVVFAPANGTLGISSFGASPDPVSINSATTLSVSAQGGATPYSFSYSGLPPGCSGSDTASLSCTPTSTGTYSVAVTVTDASSPSQSATSSLVLTVNSAPSPLTIQSFTVSPSTIPLGGTADLNVSVSGGVAPYTYAYSGLPRGCGSANSSTLLCTPGSSGSFTVTVVVTDSGGGPVSGTASFTVTSSSNPLTLDSFTASPNPVLLNNATTFVANVSGGAPPYAITYTGLPPGCSGSSTPDLPCTPTLPGSYRVSIAVTDSVGGAVSANITLVVDPSTPLWIQSFSASPSTIILGATTYLNVSVGGGTQPFAYGYGPLPPGCTSADTPTLACAPSVSGTYGGITVTVYDANGNHATSGPVALQVNALGAPTITSASVSPTNISLGGSAYVNISVSGGAVPYTYNFSGLPPGCVSRSVSDLRCSPSQAGSYGITVSVTGANGQMAQSPTLVLTVQSPPGYPIISDFAASPALVTLGNPTTLVVSATGGVSPYSYVFAGLPQGCASSDGPSLPCTPTVTGQFTLLVVVTDAQGHAVSATTPLRVLAAPSASVNLTSIAVSPDPAVVGTPLTLRLTASGGTPPLDFSYVGLPPGCPAKDTPDLTCTPTQSGRFVVGITVTDAVGVSARGSVNLTVAAAGGSPLAFQSFTASPASLTEGATTYLNVSAQGGSAPYAYSYSGLPPGCVSSDLADLRCTPTAAGTYSIIVTVNDASGGSVSGSVTLNVQAPPSPGSAAPAGSGVANTTGILVGVLAVTAGIFSFILWRRLRGSPPRSR